MSKVKIISDGVKTKVFIDDKALTRCTALKLTQNGGEIPILDLKIVPESFEVDGKNIPIKFSEDGSFVAENLKTGKMQLNYDYELKGSED
jgi:hypothetical protein